MAEDQSNLRLQQLVQENTERTLGAMHLRIIILEAEKATLSQAFAAFVGEDDVSDETVEAPVGPEESLSGQQQD